MGKNAEAHLKKYFEIGMSLEPEWWWNYWHECKGRAKKIAQMCPIFSINEAEDIEMGVSQWA